MKIFYKLFTTVILLLLCLFSFAQQSSVLTPDATPTVTCDSMLSSPCPGSSALVRFTVTGGTFPFGNIFTAQLSNAFGSFAAPVNIGSVPYNTGFIIATIPISTGLGFLYRVRIVTSNPVDTSNVSPNTILILQVAQLNHITVSPHNYICPGEIITLTDLNYGSTFAWSTGATTQSIQVTQPGIYTVTSTNIATCKATTSDTLVAPVVVNAGTDGAICRYDSLQVGAALVPGQNYMWSPSAGLNNAALPNPIASPSATTTYTLSISSSICGMVRDSVTVTVHQLPPVETGPNNTISIGLSTQLSATGGIQYSWSPSYGLSNANISNPVANPTITTTYIITVTDTFGCHSSDSVTVFVISKAFWLPTAFTPDGNGQNDVLFVRGVDIQNFEFTIFNRWGEKIFEAKNMQLGWDGTKQGTGEPMPQGAYPYFIKGTLSNGDPVDAKGLVNLIR